MRERPLIPGHPAEVQVRAGRHGRRHGARRRHVTGTRPSAGGAELDEHGERAGGPQPGEDGVHRGHGPHRVDPRQHREAGVGVERAAHRGDADGVDERVRQQYPAQAEGEGDPHL